MNLPEWCQTHSLKEFLELMEEDLGLKDQRKEKNMNDQVQNVQKAPVELTAETAAKLQELAQKLDAEGHVLVQTEADVGTEKPTQVH